MSAKSSKNLTDLTKARSVRDIRVVVDRINDGISEIKSTPTRISLKSESSSTVIEAGDLIKKTGGSKLFDGSYENDINIPKNINVDANQLTRIRNYIAELSTAKTLALSPEFNNLKSTKPLLSAITSAVREAEVLVRTQLKSMHVTARESVPEEHKKVVVAVRNHIKKIIPKERYTAIKPNASYVVPDSTAVQGGWLKPSGKTNNVLFQTFIPIEDLVDREGYAYSLIFVVTSRLEQGRLRFYVTSLKSNRVPGSFPVGANILSPAKMRLQLNALLSVDGFVGEMDRKPIGKTSRDLRAAGITEIDGVSGATVRDDQIILSLAGLTPKEEQQTIVEVRTVLSHLLKLGNKNMIRHKLVKGSRAGVKLLKISIGAAEKPNKLELTYKKAQTFADILGLDVKQTRSFMESAK